MGRTNSIVVFKVDDGGGGDDDDDDDASLFQVVLLWLLPPRSPSTPLPPLGTVEGVVPNEGETNF